MTHRLFVKEAIGLVIIPILPLRRSVPNWSIRMELNFR